MPDNSGKKYKRDESHEGTRLSDELVIEALIKHNGNKTMKHRKIKTIHM